MKLLHLNLDGGSTVQPIDFAFGGDGTTFCFYILPFLHLLRRLLRFLPLLVRGCVSAGV